jgi:uroporphyrinogen-III synthase
MLAPVMAVRTRPLKPPGRPQAVVVTSGNAIAALPASLHSVPLLAVGDATAERATAAGFQDVHSAGRDAAALAQLACRMCKQAGGPLLLASGERQGLALAAELRTYGFRVERRVAYATRAAEALPAEARAALASGTIRAALFFSPQSARVFVTILQRDMPASSVRGIEALTISHTTEAALKALPWLRVRVASHPNQEELLKLLQ